MYHSLVVAALLAANAVATPVRPIAAKRNAADGGFSLPVTRKNLSHMLSGSAVTAKTYHKYGGTLPEGHPNNRHSKVKVDSGSGSVVAQTTQYDQEYLANIWIGSQSLALDLDTGSSDLWVFSSELPAAQQVGHSIYNPNKSSTAHHLANQTWSITYGDNSYASGDVWTDCVWVGGTVVENQAVETAQEISASFQADVNNDGIMGLGFDVLNNVRPTEQKTFISNAINQGLPNPVFTASLKYHADGSYDFGFIDRKKHTGTIVYTPVDADQGYWFIQTSSFGFKWSNGSSVEYPFVDDAIVDTGTSITYLGTNVARGYWDLVPGAGYDYIQGGYTFPCNQTDSLPDLLVGIGTYTATVAGKYLSYSPLGDGSDNCFGGLQSNQGLPFSILGDTFLKSVFVVFNAGNPPKLGFADQA